MRSYTLWRRQVVNTAESVATNLSITLGRLTLPLCSPWITFCIHAVSVFHCKHLRQVTWGFIYRTLLCELVCWMLFARLSADATFGSDGSAENVSPFERATEQFSTTWLGSKCSPACARRYYSSPTSPINQISLLHYVSDHSSAHVSSLSRFKRLTVFLTCN